MAAALVALGCCMGLALSLIHISMDAAAAEGLQAGRPSCADDLDEGEWTVEPLWPEADLDQPKQDGEPTDEEPSCCLLYTSRCV